MAHADDLSKATTGLTIDERAQRIRLLLFDVDGVLTDGVIVMHADGSECKSFHIRTARRSSGRSGPALPVGLLSARASGATAHRAAQLGDPHRAAGRDAASSTPTSRS